MSEITWEPLSRDYEADKRKKQLKSVDSSQFHPLLPKNELHERSARRGQNPPSVPKTGSDNIGSTFLDPLSSMLASEISDPLGATNKNQIRHQTSSKLAIVSESKARPDDDEPGYTSSWVGLWGVKTAAMRHDFTSVEKIHISMDILGDENDNEPALFGGMALPKKAERSRARLEQLERQSGVSQTAMSGLTVSYNEFEQHISNLHSSMRQAWKGEEKVQALKLTIQAAKKLGDTSVPGIYPAVFAMVSDILDDFGNMVFLRIKERAEEPSARDPFSLRLQENFSCRQIPEEAKEVCRNWFFKVACIRELLPRILIEIALVKSTMFLCDNQIPSVLARLTSTIRGIGDPLVALYARCYLAHWGTLTVPNLKGYLFQNFKDYLVSLKDFRLHKVSSVLQKTKMSETEYFHLHEPAVEWLLKCLGKDSSQELFEQVLAEYNDLSDSSTVLYHILEAFPSSCFQPHALELVMLIKNARPTHISIVHIFKLLGDHFISDPPPVDIRLLVLNEVWKVCTQCEDFPLFVRCASSWLEVLANHYRKQEVMVLLGDVVAHLEAVNDPSIASRELENLLLAVVRHCHHFGAALLTSEYLIKILDTFKLSKKAEVCKDVLENFAQAQKEPTNDPILIHTIFGIARTLHDSVDDLSADGEQRYIAGLICGFIERIDFRRDLEQQLNIYVECRAAFPNLDPVKTRLVISTAGLAIKAHKFVKGNHTRKTAAFVKSCLAYCYITIPSIDDIFKRLHLLQLCGHISLINKSLSQADSFFKAAISLIAEVPAVEEVGLKRISTEAKLVSFVRSFLGGLIVVPGNPENGPLYLLTGLMNAVSRYQWQPNSGVKTSVYLALLNVLCAYAQKKLPYTVQGVDSNDLLYAQNSEYLESLQQKVAMVFQVVVEQLAELGASTDLTAKAQYANLILDLVNEIVDNFIINAGVANFIFKLLELVKKTQKEAPANYFFKTTMKIKSFAESSLSTSMIDPQIIVILQSAVKL